MFLNRQHIFVDSIAKNLENLRVHALADCDGMCIQLDRVAPNGRMPVRALESIHKKMDGVGRSLYQVMTKYIQVHSKSGQDARKYDEVIVLLKSRLNNLGVSYYRFLSRVLNAVEMGVRDRSSVNRATLSGWLPWLKFLKAELEYLNRQAWYLAATESKGQQIPP